MVVKTMEPNNDFIIFTVDLKITTTVTNGGEEKYKDNVVSANRVCNIVKNKGLHCTKIKQKQKKPNKCFHFGDIIISAQ